MRATLIRRPGCKIRRHRTPRVDNISIRSRVRRQGDIRHDPVAPVSVFRVRWRRCIRVDLHKCKCGIGRGRRDGRHGDDGLFLDLADAGEIAVLRRQRGESDGEVVAWCKGFWDDGGGEEVCGFERGEQGGDGCAGHHCGGIDWGGFTFFWWFVLMSLVKSYKRSSFMA